MQRLASCQGKGFQVPVAVWLSVSCRRLLGCCESLTAMATTGSQHCCLEMSVSCIVRSEEYQTWQSRGVVVAPALHTGVVACGRTCSKHCLTQLLLFRNPAGKVSHRDPTPTRRMSTYLRVRHVWWVVTVVTDFYISRCVLRGKSQTRCSAPQIHEIAHPPRRTVWNPSETFCRTNMRADRISDNGLAGEGSRSASHSLPHRPSPILQFGIV